MSSSLQGAASATTDQVTRDANLIARNLACHGFAQGAMQTAQHIRNFWAPLLRATLFEQARSHPERLSPMAREAIALLRNEASPADRG